MTGSQKAIKIISIILIVVGIVALIAGLITFAGGMALVGAGAEASSIDQQFYVSSAWCWCTYQWGYRSTHWYFWIAWSKRSSENWTFLCVFDNWFGAFYS